jgi:hypothetical protein
VGQLVRVDLVAEGHDVTSADLECEHADDSPARQREDERWVAVRGRFDDRDPAQAA